MVADLQRGLERIAGGVRADWGVHAKLLGTGEEVGINADTPMDTMSVIKVPILVELYRGADVGRIDLDERVQVEARHRRPGTGVLQFLDDGLRPTLRDAAALMIAVSDNTATDICLEAVGGPAAVNGTMRDLGFPSIVVTATTHDWFTALAAEVDPTLASLPPVELYVRAYPGGRLASMGRSNDEMAQVRERFHFGGASPFGQASARHMTSLLEMLYRGDCASPSSCGEMLDFLRAQQFNSRIPRYLSGVARAAHKTGDFDPFIANDAGVIELAAKPPVIVTFFAMHHRGYWTNIEEAIGRMTELICRYAIER